MKSAFVPEDVEVLKRRVLSLKSDSKPLWGTMSPDKMLAHCNTAYELVYNPPKKNPNPAVKLFLKLFVKRTVIGESPYSKNLMTAPYFVIKEEKDFQKEKDRLLSYLDKTLKLGSPFFEEKESYSFGKLNAKEWSNMFIKHLEHHLSQYNV